MQENGTVQQLSEALNQLLDAYEILQKESKEFKEDNDRLKKEIDDLQLQNKELESRLTELDNATQHNSTEMDTMLERIESVLSSNEQKKEDIIQDDIESIIDQEIKVSDHNVTIEEAMEVNNSVSEKKEENKEIDLGRMQSLLNGFNN